MDARCSSSSGRPKGRQRNRPSSGASRRTEGRCHSGGTMSLRGDLPAHPPRLCAWAGMASGMRSAPQVSAKGELHTSPATGGAMWAASPYSALCTDPTGCQDGSAQAEESVSRFGEGKTLRSQLRGGAAMSRGALDSTSSCIHSSTRTMTVVTNLDGDYGGSRIRASPYNYKALPRTFQEPQKGLSRYFTRDKSAILT